MDLNTLKASLSKAITDSKLELSQSLPGIDWDLPTAIKNNLKLDTLSLEGADDNLTVVDASGGTVEVDKADVPSLMISGKPVGPDKILNIPIAKFKAITLFVSPVDTDKSDDQAANYTLILEFDKLWDGTTGWTPGDSFPALAKRMGFSALQAIDDPAFLLSSFEHAQAWNYSSQEPQNTSPEVFQGLNLQLPSGISTSLFPVIRNFFGDISAFKFFFNGPIDNSKLTTDSPNELTVELLADMGDSFTKSFSGTGGNNFPLKFDIGVDAFPVILGGEEEDNDDNEGETSDTGEEKTPAGKPEKQESEETPSKAVNTELLLQASLQDKFTIHAVVPFLGNTISFGVEGPLNKAPILSIGDVVHLFSPDYLSGNVPTKFKKEGSFLDHIGVYKLGLDINVPQLNRAGTNKAANTPKISSTMLEVGYGTENKEAPGIGYPPWFTLNEFFVTWMVDNPFTPEADPSVLFKGDFKLLGGEIEFTGSFSKKEVETETSDDDDIDTNTLEIHPVLPQAVKGDDTPAQKKWIFEIEGGLKDTSVDENGKPIKNPEKNVIQLTQLLKQYDSVSDDLPDIDIDKCHFLAQPDEKTYQFNFEIEAHNWSFKNYKAPIFEKIALDIKKADTVITGKLDTVFGISTDDPEKPILFELSAERSEKAWTFEGKLVEEFSIGNFAEAVGIDNHPDYLDDIAIIKTEIKYVAPIKEKNDDKNTEQDSEERSLKKGELLKAEKEETEDDQGDKTEPTKQVFSIDIEAKFPINNEELDVELKFKKTKDEWDLEGILKVHPKGVDEKETAALEFDFEASSAKEKPAKDLPIDQPQNKAIESAASSDSKTKLIAKLRNPADKPLNISDFAEALSLPVPHIPDELNDIELKEAHFEYLTSKKSKSFLLAMDSEKFGKLIFLAVKVAAGEGENATSSWKPFFGAALGSFMEIDFTHLPVVGDFIGQFGHLSINTFKLVAWPKDLSEQDIPVIKALLQEKDNKDYPQLPALPKGQKSLTKGGVLSANLNIDQKSKPLELAFGGKAQSTTAGFKGERAIAAAAQAETDDKSAEGNATQKVSKSFGPVEIDKFNLSYSDGKIGIDINGALTLAGITMSFQGLGIKSKIPPKELSDISFQLHGLGVNVQKGNFQLTGGFITLDDNYNSYMGMVAITAGQVGFQAFGGYSSATPAPSFFIFLHLKMPIGGPPFFFVTGISGGLGINRDFILPTFDELDTFPLLPGGDNNPIPTDKPANLNAITDVLTSLAKFIPPKDGAYWIALGLDFTSFKFIEVSAILEVSFGASFQIGLLGNASISIPEPNDPLAFISINFLVEFIPDKGILAVLGKITPASFIFSKDCRLTGGFAFFLWFEGSDHEGDFVITIGGYHPAFKPPAHYPSVPRMELKWDLGPLKIDGKSYFALTPHMLMAGMSVNATFEAGPVKAWFDLGVDFLLGWKPFMYLADAYIHIGASIKLLFTITVQIGAELNIWGPEFGGKARVELSIFSFTIYFGSDGPTPPPIPWSEFKKMLPNSHPEKTAVPQEQPATRMLAARAAKLEQESSSNKFSVASVNISKGMLQQATKDPIPPEMLADESYADVYNWMIDPNHFEILVATGVPSSDFIFNTIDTSDPEKPYEKAYKPAEKTDGQLGKYLNPNNLDDFFTNKNDDPNTDTLIAYNYDKYTADEYWWKQPIGAGPPSIKSSDFHSISSIQIVKIHEHTTDVESNFVVTIVSKNTGKALWGEQVTPTNGDTNLNAEPTLKNTLGGFVISPKIWNPLQTRAINIYLLLFNDGNNLCWPKRTLPQIGPNKFEEKISEDGNSMTFNLPEVAPGIESTFRTLNDQAFTKLATGAQIISVLGDAYGLADLSVDTDATQMAAVMYKDWPILALLGEEDEQAANPVS